MLGAGGKENRKKKADTVIKRARVLVCARVCVYRYVYRCVYRLPRFAYEYQRAAPGIGHFLPSDLRHDLFAVCN